MNQSMDFWLKVLRKRQRHHYESEASKIEFKTLLYRTTSSDETTERECLLTRRAMDTKQLSCHHSYLVTAAARFQDHMKQASERFKPLKETEFE